MSSVTFVMDFFVLVKEMSWARFPVSVAANCSLNC